MNKDIESRINLLEFIVSMNKIKCDLINIKNRISNLERRMM